MNGKVRPSANLIKKVVADDIDDTGRYRLAADDKEAVWKAAMVFTMLHEIDEIAAKRIEHIDRGKWRIKTLLGHYQKFYEGFLATIPFDQLLTVERQMDNIGYSVGVKSAQGKYLDKEYGIYLSNEQFGTLISACKDHCIVCDKDKQEQRKCKLKKMFDALPLIRESTDVNGNCVYFDELMLPAER